MKFSKHCTIGVVALFSLCIMFGGTLYAEDVIKIGYVGPLTGNWSDEGAEQIRGFEMALDEINASGGLLGKKVVVIKGDVGDFSGEKIVSVGEKLVYRDKVDVLISQFLGGLVDIKTFGEYDIPYLHMDTSQSASDLVEQNIEKYNNIFQTCPPETGYAKGILDFISNGFAQKAGYKYPNKKIALITMVRGYNDRISKRFRELVKKSDWKIVVDEKTPTGTVEWGPVLNKIRQAKPAVIYFNDHVPTDEVSFLEQFHRNPTKSMIFMQYGPSNPAFLDLGKENCNGIFWGTTFVSFGEKGTAFRAQYEKRYKEKAGFGTGAGIYTSLNIWVEAVKKVGNISDYAAIRRTLLGYPWNITGGVHVFNPSNQTAIEGPGLMPFMIYQVQNQEHKAVSPSVHADGKVQVPSWMK